jgi:hypothetical protein
MKFILFSVYSDYYSLNNNDTLISIQICATTSWKHQCIPHLDYHIL